MAMRYSESCPAISKMPAHLKVLDLLQFFLLLDKLTKCPGHPIIIWSPWLNTMKVSLCHKGGDVTTYLDSNTAVQQIYCETVRSSSCHFLISSSKCPACVGYRSTLRSIHHKWQKIRNCQHHRLPASTVMHDKRWLNSPQVRAKAAQLKKGVRSTEIKLKYLEEKNKSFKEKLAV